MQVVELSEASKQLAQSSSRDQNNIDAFRFLTQKNFDAKQLYEDVNSMVVNVSNQWTHEISPQFTTE